MTTPRYEFQMVLLSDGTVLAAGGIDNNGDGLASSEVYNPATKTWAATIGPMTTPQSDFQMVLLLGCKDSFKDLIFISSDHINMRMATNNSIGHICRSLGVGP